MKINMRASFQTRLIIAVGVSLGSGFLVSGYILHKFRGYEDSASHVMSGDQRNVIQGHLVEARVKAAIELAQGSVNSEQANDAFREKLVALSEDVKNLTKEHPDRLLDDARKSLNVLITAKSDAMEDLFVQYRNLKTTAFNAYRMAWANKWMMIAHNVGLLINDLDNLPYHAGEKAAASVYSKIGPLSSLITNSPLSQDSKLQLFAQLSTLKNQVGQYTDAIQRSEKLKIQRTDDLKSLAGTIKKYNEAQGKSMMQFGNEARSEVFKGVLAFLFFILFAMGWYWVVLRNFMGHLTGVTTHITQQFTTWLSPGGSITTEGFSEPEEADAEFREAFQAIDKMMRRMNSIRKEDILVKRLLNVPFVLVHRNKQAIFWNSALSILGRVRALEEMGPVTYTNLLRFTSIQGKAVDPIEKAFTENKETSQLALMRVGDDGLAIQAICTPVLGADHQAEYVMVHIRDLRDENRRAESELDRQLECVRTAIEFVKAGKVPPEAGPTLRKPVVDAVQALKQHSLEVQEKSEVMARQLEAMRTRMSREAQLKKSVHGRMEQVREEVLGLCKQVNDLRTHADATIARMGQIDSRTRSLRVEYDEIRRRGSELKKSLGTSNAMISSCLERLGQSEEISSRIRANERMINSMLEKSTVLNANNSILGSKRELTPSDVVTITENVTQLMGQFKRSYSFIEQSVGDVERSMGELTVKLRENLSACSKLVTEDQDILKSVQDSERLIAARSTDAADIGRELAALKVSSSLIGSEMKVIESKLKSLVQIGQASIELQSQLEIGFQGIFENVDRGGDAKLTRGLA